MAAPYKRRRDDFVFNGPSSHQTPFRGENDATLSDDYWSGAALFALEVPPPPPELALGFNDTNALPVRPNKKRGHDTIGWEEDLGFLVEEQDSVETQQWLRENFPELYPSLPLIEDRVVEPGLDNPYIDNGTAHHLHLRSNKRSDFDGLADNGLIKFRLRMTETSSNVSKTQREFSTQRTLGIHHRPHPHLSQPDVPLLPPDFGRGLNLNESDNLVAYCDGRTLLPKSNGWYNDVAPMAAESDCVKHAVLALAGTYLLDYLPSVGLQRDANYHYKRAVGLLREALENPQIQEVGKEDAVVSALALLNIDDLVNWELHQPRNTEPKWYRGVRTAKKILDNSDPGYRYWKPGNVQSSNARLSNGSLIALYDITSQPMMPLEAAEEKCPYSWLLEGTEKDVRKIHGLTGMSSKLLHSYAQITHLAARLKQEPDSLVISLGAKKLEERLINFHQESDLSRGYPSAEALLASCELNIDGKIDSSIKMTELTGETYVEAAQIYLHCRLFRKPRKHPVVQERLNVLLRCIERTPATGELFTAQAPLFPVFIAGLVAFRAEDRQVVRDWFEATLSGSRGVSTPT
ncbi:MAG: hypothetical protein Q9220_001877 [cf. Caloplaca sp. 1 TL-2023]